MRAWLERHLDPLMWGWCGGAYLLVMVLPPAPRGSRRDRFWFWLLPFAGYYGYHEEGMPWRWSERRR